MSVKQGYLVALLPMLLAGLGQAAPVAADTAQEARPRIMHAEMVTHGERSPAHSMTVADTPPAVAPVDRPRMFEMPLIDKSKAEDPRKGASAQQAPAAAPAVVAPAKPVAAPPAPAVAATKPAPPAPVQELSRQQREMILATSGPRKAAQKPLVASEPAPDFSHVHWGYSGLGGPENWSKLSPKNSSCAVGKRQSPIDIRGGIKVDLEPIRFDYRPSQFRIVDNGHTVQVDIAEGNGISLQGRHYQLLQFHFHRPSEERVNGKGYEMVAHLVHKDYDNNYAVVAVLMERGSEHPIIQTLWNYMPLEVGMESSPPNVYLDLAKLLPESRDYYTYMGSLTTPPCSENVLWMVMKTPVELSPQQIGIFARLYPNNARPVQPVNDRLIKESR